MQQLASLNVWSRVKPLSLQSQTRTAAIAYVTSDTLIAFGAGDMLVTDASDNAIACGETSARVLEEAIGRGASVFSCPGLHAKVLVFDTIAVIGSANLSQRSERDLVEAVWVTDDPTVVSEARSFVASLAAQSQRIDGALLQRILSIKVARRLPTLSARDRDLRLEEVAAQGQSIPPKDSSLSPDESGPAREIGQISLAQESSRTPDEDSAPEVTIASAHTEPVIRFYNPGVSLEQLQARDHPMAPKTDFDLAATGRASMPDGGLAVVIKTLSQSDGASYAQVWTALRAAGVKGWNKARHLNGRSDSNGFGMVRKHGYRLTYCVSTGKYHAIRE